MSYAKVCAQCGRDFESRRPDAGTCSEECKYQRWIETNLETPEPVEPHDLQLVRERRATSKHNRDLGGLIRQAIVDTIRSTGECHADDLIPFYPENEVDRCRELATAQFGSLAAPRGGREPLIREKSRRKSSIPARKGAKSTVWEFTPAGRIHYGIVGLDAGGDGLPRATGVQSGDLPAGVGQSQDKRDQGGFTALPSSSADAGTPVSSTEDQLVEKLCEEFEAEVVEESSEPSTLFGPGSSSAYSAWEDAA